MKKFPIMGILVGISTIFNTLKPNMLFCYVCEVSDEYQRGVLIK